MENGHEYRERKFRDDFEIKNSVDYNLTKVSKKYRQRKIDRSIKINLSAIRMYVYYSHPLMKNAMKDVLS